MTGKEVGDVCIAFADAKTCYLAGCFGQELTQTVYNEKVRQYPRNEKYGNADKVGKGYHPFDCICLIKGVLASARPDHYINYADLLKNPLGDCTNEQFLNALYDCCEPAKAPKGYGLASKSHAAVALGDGMWVDCNFGNGQNGVCIHAGAPTWAEKAGKIPGVDYDQEPEEEREILMRFVTWLVDEYLKV